MESALPHLLDLVVLLGAAVSVLLLARWLRLPPIAGLLLAGVLVGPTGLGGIRNPHTVEVLAELGVVLLLFVIGLEISRQQLSRLRRFILVGGSVQAAATVALTFVVSVFLGLSARTALFLGFVVALSSTAIVLKLYSERAELDAPQGRAVMGVLVMQDLLVVPLLLLVPILAGRSDASGPGLLVRFGGGLGLIAALFVAGRFLLPRLLQRLARSRIHELFLLAGLFACLGAALVTEALGFSMALGAFIAGLLIAESEYAHQVLAETAPFRDLFSSLFFVSIGMLVDLHFVAANLAAVLLVGLGILLLKLAAGTFAIRLLRLPWRVALLAGFGLAQVGEFSFVLLQVGLSHELITAQLHHLVLAAAVLTLLAAPLVIAEAPRLASWVTRGRDAEPASPRARDVQVVIAGLGLNGRNLSRVLRAANISYRIVDLDPRKADRARRDGEPILFGDITRRDIQLESGIEDARIAVFALSDAQAQRTALRLARSLNPEICLLVRTRQLDEIEELVALGADAVIAEELETSIEIVTRVLDRLHVPGNVIRAQARLLRAETYEMLRQPTPLPLSPALAKALAAGATETALLSSEDAAVGHTLADLRLRTLTGASVIAVVRADQAITNPGIDLVFEPGDVLVLVGGHAQIEAALALLGPTADGAV